VLTIALADLPEDKVLIMKEIVEKMWINLQANLELPNKIPGTLTDMIGQKTAVRETPPSQH
jgi:hypothetical protein